MSGETKLLIWSEWKDVDFSAVMANIEIDKAGTGATKVTDEAERFRFSVCCQAKVDGYVDTTGHSSGAGLIFGVCKACKQRIVEYSPERKQWRYLERLASALLEEE